MIKKRLGGKITALSMGALSAESTLRQTLAIGADEGVLLSDKAFRGADVCVTAYTLAQAVTKLGGADLILCGQQTTDGDTAQTPFSLAARLNIPAVGFVKAIEFTGETPIFIQELSGASAAVEARFPMVAAIGLSAAAPLAASLKERLDAAKKPLKIWGLSDMPDSDGSNYGLIASPTRVIKISRISTEQKNPPITEPPADTAERILKAVRAVVGGR
jgi:electron transfer flavoprotein beta subunit